MPLTPTDVQNKQFKVAFRGYSLDEVDAFLDEVESELGRLLRENDELRTSGPTPAPTTSTPVADEPAARPLATMEGQEAALRTLLLAQRTADEAVAEARAEAAQLVEAARVETESTLGAARAEADTTLTDARAEAERTVTEAKAYAERTVAEAQAQAERTLSEARSEADSTLTGARTEAQSTLTAARENATRADAEVAAKVAASLGHLDERRTLLERQIEDLRAFEREYRTRLKAYLQTQLQDLEDRNGPDDGSAGVPDGAPARAAGQLSDEPVGAGLQHAADPA